MKAIASFIVCVAVVVMGIGCGQQHQQQTSRKENVLSNIQKVSYTIDAAEDRVGSGVMITRRRGNENVHFVWTAAHVVSKNLVLELDTDPDTNVQTLVGTHFIPLKVGQPKYINGKYITEPLMLDADIIRYSTKFGGKDLALIQVRSRNLTTNSVTFLEHNLLPKVGSSIWHCGTMGWPNPNSVSDGTVAAIGRGGEEGVTVDQASIICAHGSSGGGVFLKSNGKCIGLLTHTWRTTLTVMYMTPAREIYNFAKTSNCLWAVDPSVPVPSDEEIRATPGFHVSNMKH
jgi:hypothetical protein